MAVNANASTMLELVAQDAELEQLGTGFTFTEGPLWNPSGYLLFSDMPGDVRRRWDVAETCRARGVPVIHIWYIVEPGATGLRPNAPLFQGVRDANALVRGSWGAAPADGLEPHEGDHVVEKMRINGFFQTRLDILLRGLGSDTIVITGAWTNMSIEHTARHGADAGYEVVVASDGTSTTGEEWQNAALNYAMTNVAQVASCAQIARALGA